MQGLFPFIALPPFLGILLLCHCTQDLDEQASELGGADLIQLCPLRFLKKHWHKLEGGQGSLWFMKIPSLTSGLVLEDLHLKGQMEGAVGVPPSLLHSSFGR